MKRSRMASQKELRPQYTLSQLLVVLTVIVVGVFIWTVIAQSFRTISYTTDGMLLNHSKLGFTFVWVLDENKKPVAGLVACGSDRPFLRVSNRGDFYAEDSRIEVPLDGSLYVLAPENKLHLTKFSLSSLVFKKKLNDLLIQKIGPLAEPYKWQTQGQEKEKHLNKNKVPDKNKVPGAKNETDTGELSGDSR